MNILRFFSLCGLFSGLLLAGCYQYRDSSVDIDAILSNRLSLIPELTNYTPQDVLSGRAVTIYPVANNYVVIFDDKKTSPYQQWLFVNYSCMMSTQYSGFMLYFYSNAFPEKLLYQCIAGSFKPVGPRASHPVYIDLLEGFGSIAPYFWTGNDMSLLRDTGGIVTGDMSTDYIIDLSKGSRIYANLYRNGYLMNPEVYTSGRQHIRIFYLQDGLDKPIVEFNPLPR